MSSEYINVYINAISEYIRSLEKAEFLNDRCDLIAIGFRALTHVFNMNYLNSNLETALYSSQKAHIYYIEYLSQTKYDLNPTNAILFIYTKTLGMYKENNAKPPFDLRISKVAELLYWWENPNIVPSQIPKSLVYDYLSSSNEYLSFYLETIHKRQTITPTEYIQLLPKLLTLRKSPFNLRDVDETEPYNLWVSKIMEP